MTNTRKDIIWSSISKREHGKDDGRRRLTCIYIYMHTYIYTYVHMYVYIYIYIYTRMHTGFHTWLTRFSLFVSSKCEYNKLSSFSASSSGEPSSSANSPSTAPFCVCVCIHTKYVCACMHTHLCAHLHVYMYTRLCAYGLMSAFAQKYSKICLFPVHYSQRLFCCSASGLGTALCVFAYIYCVCVVHI